MIKLDPKLVDQDSVRKQKRRHYFRIAFFPCVIWALCALFALRQPIYNLTFQAALNHDELKLANSLNQFQFFMNLAEPKIAYHNDGLIKMKQGDYSGAEQSFRKSILRDYSYQDECANRINLSLSLEMQASENFYAGNFNDALGLYSRADASLPTPTNQETRHYSCNEQQEAKVLSSRERIEKSRHQTIARRNNIIIPSDHSAQKTPSPIDTKAIDEIRAEQNEHNKAAANIRNKIGSKEEL